MLVSGLLIVSCLTLGVFCHDFVLSCDPLCVTGNLCGFQLFLRFVCWKISVFPKVPTVWDLMTWTSTGVNGREHWSDWQSLETRCVTQWIEKWALGSTDVTLQLRHWSDSQCFETRRVSLWVMSLNCCANLPPRLDYNCKQVFTVDQLWSLNWMLLIDDIIHHEIPRSAGCHCQKTPNWLWCLLWNCSALSRDGLNSICPPQLHGFQLVS